MHQELSDHLLMHSYVQSDKPYQCDMCDKAFTQSSHLDTHRKIHSGLKPFQCEECDKTFARKGDLTVHSRTHSGEKPYQCEYCDKAFAQSSHLNTHRKTHTGGSPTKVHLVPATEEKKSPVKLDDSVSQEVEPFVCNFCG